MNEFLNEYIHIILRNGLKVYIFFTIVLAPDPDNGRTEWDFLARRIPGLFFHMLMFTIIYNKAFIFEEPDVTERRQ
jgi:hypothetical protein